MATALIYHPLYLRHDTGTHHPERASRLQAVLRKLKKTGLIDRLDIIEPEPATVEDVALTHSRDYIIGVEEACKCAPANLDPDTVVSGDSFKTALLAAGGVMKAADLVVSGKYDNAFCLVRPPGHHARPSQAMGFCIFNNAAIGARYIQKKYNIGRVAIIDWDAHHGNGTEEIFYNDPSVFYISLHQYPYYPGTGSGESVGEGKGKGFNLNIPMRAGSNDEDYIKAFEKIIVPKMEKFKPEFILISAGFDSHRDDPLSSLNITEAGYKKMTEIIKKMASIYSKNRLISILEGGYNLLSLARSTEEHIKALIMNGDVSL